jgi:hypothetical protein
MIIVAAALSNKNSTSSTSEAVFTAAAWRTWNAKNLWILTSVGNDSTRVADAIAAGDMVSNAPAIRFACQQYQADAQRALTLSDMPSPLAAVHFHAAMTAAIQVTQDCVKGLDTHDVTFVDNAKVGLVQVNSELTQVLQAIRSNS